MAKYECMIRADMDDLLRQIDDGVIKGSVSASYEDGSDFETANLRSAVRVYERFSYLGSNRVSLNICVTNDKAGDELHLSAITAGGSQAMLFKINTIGEDAFLEKLVDILKEFPIRNELQS